MVINVDFVDKTIDFVLLLSVYIITKYKHVINIVKIKTTHVHVIVKPG